MNVAVKSAPPKLNIDLSAAFYFLFAVVIWELLFNRLAWDVGVFRRIGAVGSLAALAMTGQFAMAGVGTMSLILTCAGLPRIAGNPRFGPLPVRVVLILISPFFLPVICVAIFRPVSLELILYAYLAVIGSAVLLALMTASRNLHSSQRRLLVALGGMEFVGALCYLFAESGIPYEMMRTALLFAEVLFVVTPIFGFFILIPGPLLAFAKRPHTLGLFFACVVTCVAVFIVLVLPGEGVLQTVAHRTMDIRIPVAAGVPLYIVALFLGSLLVGTLVLPSRTWRPSTHSRRIGMGLLCIWSSGIQPVRPYQFALVFVGFLYLCRGLLGDLESEEDTEASAAVDPE